MSVWDHLDIAQAPVAALQRDLSADRVSHAYLFSGSAGRVPLDVALAFAAALICPDAGCGTCAACVRTVRHAHPDVELIEPAGMQLLADQVRDVVRAAMRRPVAGPRRVIIVAGSDRMNPTAQNSFLKALEEPPASTTIVLLAPSADVLLETVRSRCREIIFHGPPERDVAEALIEQGVEAELARSCARVGGGLARAATLATEPEVFALRRELVERTIRPLRDPGEALELAEWLHGQTRAMRDRVADRHAEDEEAYGQWLDGGKRAATDRLRREQRRVEQDALEGAVDDVASVLRDLVIAASSADHALLNEDARDAIIERAGSLGPRAAARVLACLSDVERCRRRLRANANVLLALEDAFLSVYRNLSAAA